MAGQMFWHGMKGEWKQFVFPARLAMMGKEKMRKWPGVGSDDSMKALHGKELQYQIGEHRE